MGNDITHQDVLYETLPEDDPVLVETVERKLEPLKKTLSPAMVEHFRREALFQLSGHPRAVALAKALKGRTAKQKSEKGLVNPSSEEPSGKGHGGGTPR
jgi:hypothetical protein